MRAWPALFLLTLLATAGCASPHLATTSAYADQKGESYQAALEKATREAKVYSGLSTAIISRATLFTPAYLEAQGNELARRLSVPPGEREAKVRESLAPLADKVQIFLAISSPAWGSLRLDRPSNTTWSLRLVDDEGRSLAPGHIVRHMKQDGVERALFPYATTWDEWYTIDFPTRAAADGPWLFDNSNSLLELQISGMPGSARPTWNLDSDTRRTLIEVPPLAAPESPTAEIQAAASPAPELLPAP